MKALVWASVVILICSGLVAALTGVFWFILADFPFDNSTGYADKMEITRAELMETNPAIVAWAGQTVNQLGSVTMGWGLFIIALAWFGIRKSSKDAWYVLWMGGAPTLLYSSVKEIVRYGWTDTGSVLKLAAFLLFFLGMLLPINSFVGTKGETQVSVPGSQNALEWVRSEFLEDLTVAFSAYSDILPSMRREEDLPPTLGAAGGGPSGVATCSRASVTAWRGPQRWRQYCQYGSSHS